MRISKPVLALAVAAIAALTALAVYAFTINQESRQTGNLTVNAETTDIQIRTFDGDGTEQTDGVWCAGEFQAPVGASSAAWLSQHCAIEVTNLKATSPIWFGFEADGFDDPTFASDIRLKGLLVGTVAECTALAAQSGPWSANNLATFTLGGLNNTGFDIAPGASKVICFNLWLQEGDYIATLTDGASTSATFNVTGTDEGFVP